MKNLMTYLMVLALIFSAKNMQCQNWVIYNTSNSLIPYDGFNYLSIDSANIKWFAKMKASSTEVWKFDNNTTWTNILNTAYTNARDIECDLHNNVYLAMYSSLGVDEYSGGIWQPTGVIANEVAIDTNNIKWFAGGILTKYDGSIFTTYDTASATLPFQPVTRVISDKHDNIWIAGGSFGNYCIAKSSNSGANWVIFNSSNYSLLANSIVSAMVVDNMDNLWVGTGTNGIIKFDGNLWTNYTTTNSGINSDYIRCLAVDTNNRLYVGNINSPTTGLCVFDGTNWTTYDTSNSPLPSNSISAIKVDRYNNKWICNLGVAIFNESGVVGIDEKNKLTEKGFTVYPNPINDKAYIDFELDNSQTVTIEINNLLAEKISTKKVLSHKGRNTATIDVSLLPKGIYIVKIITDKQIESKKIIKE